MSYADIQYHALLSELVQQAQKTNANENRTDVKTYSLFGKQMRFDLSLGFPLLTTKKVHMKSVITELLWFLKGDTNIKYLLERNNHIWTDWRYKEYQDWHNMTYGTLNMSLSQKEFEDFIIEDEGFAETWGDIGKGYGHQWRNFGEVKAENHFRFQEGFDQISWVINEIQTNPSSRRLIVSGWNPHEVDQVDLPPCHTLFQFFVEEYALEELYLAWERKLKRPFNSRYEQGGWKSYEGFKEYVHSAMKAEGILTHKLSCQLYQRSADMFLGVPFNIASYALLTQMIAQVCGLGLGEFIWTGGDVHLYENHVEQANTQLGNDPNKYEAPTLVLNPDIKNIFDFDVNDIEVINYESFPKITAPVAV